MYSFEIFPNKNTLKKKIHIHKKEYKINKTQKLYLFFLDVNLDQERNL